MNWKEFWIGCVVVYIVYQILGLLIHQVWLGETYASLAEVWQPETEPVGFLQTAGELLNFHPHVHVFVTDGVFGPDGTFRPLS